MTTAIGKLNTGVVEVPLDIIRVGRQKLSTAQAVALDADGLLATVALPTGAAANYTTFAHTMPYARTLTAVCDGTQTGNMIVTGTDINGSPMTETIALTSTDAVAGVKAFKTVTNINLPVKVASEKINVGWGDGIGIPFILPAAKDRPLVEATLDGVTEAVVLTAHAELGGNIATLTSSLNGKEVCLYYQL